MSHWVYVSESNKKIGYVCVEAVYKEGFLYFFTDK